MSDMPPTDPTAEPAGLAERRGAPPSRTPRNPFFVTLAVLDVVLVVTSAFTWLLVQDELSRGRSGEVAEWLAGWCLRAAVAVTLLLLAIAAVRWQPPEA